MILAMGKNRKLKDAEGSYFLFGSRGTGKTIWRSCCEGRVQRCPWSFWAGSECYVLYKDVENLPQVVAELVRCDDMEG